MIRVGAEACWMEGKRAFTLLTTWRWCRSTERHRAPALGYINAYRFKPVSQPCLLKFGAGTGLELN